MGFRVRVHLEASSQSEISDVDEKKSGARKKVPYTALPMRSDRRLSKLRFFAWWFPIAVLSKGY